MNKKSYSIISTVSAEQMKEAINRSGYLLEQRVEQTLGKRGYYVETNPVFPDSDTGKSREFDIRALSATRIYKGGYNYVFPTLICECENNVQPIAFFVKESPISFLHHYDVKVSGIPVKIWQKDGYVSFSDFTGMKEFHHYCKGRVATQYCTFQLKKDKSSWVALHDEEHHNTFNSLIKALDYEIGKHFDGWSPPSKLDEESVNIQIYYPLVILQGELFTAELKHKALDLSKAKHVQFRKELFSARISEVETYQVDVISEGYLTTYLKMVESEMERIKKILQRKKNQVRASIEKIVEEAGKKRKKIKSYREYLEF
jgi:hypothetical protein